MDGRVDAAVLDPARMQGGRSAELDLRPFEIADLDRPQPMSEGNKD
jgi:hypothetical protein